MAYSDALVPLVRDPNSLVERLRTLTVQDAGQRVDPGPLDEATFNLAERVLSTSERRLWLELPRGRHDIAVMLGVYLQLLRLGERMRGCLGGMGFEGPIVVIGLNTNLTERLRRIRISGQSLSDALCAQRIRTDGQVTDLHGSLSPAKAWHDGLLYLNTSLGWPTLPGVQAGAVIVDRTSFRNPSTLDRALAWAEAHRAERLLVLADLGDVQPTACSDRSWVHWAWAPPLLCDLVYELGDAHPCGLLSTNALLAFPPAPLGTAIYQAPAIAEARRRCLAAIAAARRVRAELPGSVADTIQLINQLSGVWGRVQTANEWAVADAYGTTIATLVRKVRTARGEDLRGPWTWYAETRWAELRSNALELAELLSEYNPRLDVLLGVLDWAEAHRADHRLTVRTHTRSGALALRQDLLAERPTLAERLSDADPQTADLLLLPHSERLPWASRPSLEIHLGVPSPWRRSVMVSGEAVEHIFVLDEDERTWLEKVRSSLQREWSQILHETDKRLQLHGVPDVVWPEARVMYGPVYIDGRGAAETVGAYPAPTIDLPQLFADFASAVSSVEHVFGPVGGAQIQPTGSSSVLARPLTLEPGNTVYWLPASSRVEVLVGSRYATVEATTVTPGMKLLIPRGETRNELYQRLQQAVHRDADVMSVSILLARFRRAVSSLHEQAGSWDDVARALRTRGSSVTSGQACRLWATGEAIAPDDVEDIRRVGWLTHNQTLISEGMWQRLGALADELRRIHRELGRLLSAAIAEAASGNHGPALTRLSELCGGVELAEILEEFEVRQVRFVGPPVPTNSTQIHRLLPVPVDPQYAAR
jgi:hypothetical protein